MPTPLQILLDPVSLTVLAIMLVFGRELFVMALDPDVARTQGVRTVAMSMLLTVMAALTVVIGMRTVGLLLVSALMVVPVATANHLVIGFRRSMITAMGLGVVAAVSGTVGSYQFDTAPGALIVVIAIGLFALSWPVSLLLARRYAPVVELTDDQPPRSHEVAAEAHPHVHSDTCGHRAVPHGGHVDYIHDGHRHAAHEGHYDEH